MLCLIQEKEKIVEQGHW